MQSGSMVPCCESSVHAVRDVAAPVLPGGVVTRAAKYTLWTIALAMMCLGLRFALQQPSAHEYAAARYVFDQPLDVKSVPALCAVTIKGVLR